MHREQTIKCGVKTKHYMLISLNKIFRIPKLGIDKEPTKTVYMSREQWVRE